MKIFKKTALLLAIITAICVSLSFSTVIAKESVLLSDQTVKTEKIDRTFDFSKEEMEGKAFLFFGDSLTARYGLKATDLDYIQILRSEFGFYSYNGAVSGATWTADRNSDRYSGTNDVFTQLENAQILIRDADYISIMLGTNDYGWGLRPLGTVADNPTTVNEATTIYGAIRFVLNTLIEANPDVKIMLLTPPLWPTNGYEKENSVGVTMGDVREAVKAVGEEYKCKVVDTSSAIPNDLSYYSDGLHLKESAYYLLANFIKDYGKN